MNLIVAYDLNRTIGKQNSLPWDKNREDMQFFRQKTIEQTVIMGRVTWDSLPQKPLEHRINIVIGTKLTTSKQPDAPHYCCVDLGQAIDIADSFDRETFVIGGEQIYNLFLSQNLISKVYATQFKQIYCGDRYFPILKGNNWTSECIFDCDTHARYVFTKQ